MPKRRALDAISLDLDESDGSSAVESKIDVANILDEYVPSPDASGCKILGMFGY